MKSQDNQLLIQKKPNSSGRIRPRAAIGSDDHQKKLRVDMDQDPAPYIEMKRHGATAEEVYRKARGDGFKKYECLVLIMGVFFLELDDARKIGHQAFYQEDDTVGKIDR